MSEVITTAGLFSDLSNEFKDNGPAGFICNDKGIPVGPNERHWIDAIAASGIVIYDPLPEMFYYFHDGLWSPKTRAEVREIVDRYIRASTKARVNFDKLLSRRPLDGIVDRLAGHPCVVQRDAFAKPRLGVVLVANGRLEISRSGRLDFQAGERGKPEDLQQKRLEMNYDPAAVAIKTLAWLNRAFSGRGDDVQAIAKAMGASLWGSNRWKTLLVIFGKPNLGKSQIPLLIAELIGWARVAKFDTKHLAEKFELRRLVGRVLMIAPDVPQDFLAHTSADVLKSLTGFDALRVEGKNSNEEFELRGDKMIVVTSNYEPRVRSGVDRDALKTRLVIVEADGESYTAEEQDTELLTTLFGDAEEASGILNLALAGMRELLELGWLRSEYQMTRVRRVLDQGENVTLWAAQALELGDNSERPGVTISEGWACYRRWTRQEGVEAWPEKTFREMAPNAVERAWGKTQSGSISRIEDLERGRTCQRGWRGLKMKL
jgi:phage/plasmid-associated DNA primase